MIRTPSSADDEAVCATLAHAASLPFYARTWGAAWRRVTRAAHLRRLPLLHKADAAAHQEHMRAPSDAPSVGVISSATTRTGRPLRVPRATHGADPTRGPVTRVRLYSPRHGARGPSPAGELAFPVTLHTNTVDVLVDLLDEHRPHELVLPLSALKWITVMLEERGVKPSRFGVRVIGCTGYQVTRAARAWLEPAWRAPLVDNWSMSELEGFAHACAHCGASHWQGAPTWFELVLPASGRPVTATRGACGELVATTVLPHGALLPLVRYRTGDLVALGPPCRAAGSRGMHFVGRITASLLSRDRVLAGSAALLELGEALPDVARVPHPAEQLALVPYADLGVPKVRTRVEGRSPVVDVELRFDPRRHRARARAVEDAFAAVVDARVRIDVHRPGALDLLALARKL